MDEWKAVWDWAKSVWAVWDGYETNPYGMNTFFRSVACHIADREGLEEVGSSDVWHLTFSAAKAAKDKGVKTRLDLQEAVYDYVGL